MISNDLYMLLSIVNTKLRDRYSSLKSLAEDLDEDEREIETKLNGIGYFYDSDKNQFIAK